ncbi:hypothetical protein [Pseudomonas protegens]|uniref:hypothetical protein n=1 Tax=Pseudomonas protegens TaxID=380021 RepID=UPI00069F9ECB|nr:hypothetical protein [Pseudomonas protegens]
MSIIYERVTTFHCLSAIYHQGLAFGEAGRDLIESRQSNLFVPGMINICLATELFLKSINATMTNLEDESSLPNGMAMYVGRDDGYFKIRPSGQGHYLSELYENLPQDAKESIKSFAVKEGYGGDIADGLQQYDRVFVDWRYVYEKKDLKTLSSHPLLPICNAINAYCSAHVDTMSGATSDPIDESHPAFGTSP